MTGMEVQLQPTRRATRMWEWGFLAVAVSTLFAGLRDTGVINPRVATLEDGTKVFGFAGPHKSEPVDVGREITSTELNQELKTLLYEDQPCADNDAGNVALTSTEGKSLFVCGNPGTLLVNPEDPTDVSMTMRTYPYTQDAPSLYMALNDNPDLCMDAKAGVTESFQNEVIKKFGTRIAGQLVLTLRVDEAAPIEGCGE